MSSGRAHSVASLVLAVPTFAGVLWWTQDVTLASAAALGCAAGVLLSPDLDQQGISHGEWTLIRRTLGLGFLWLAFWHPYATLIQHRSWASHAPIVGTLLRVTYLLAIPWALGLGMLLDASSLTALCWGIMGLTVSDCAHWLMDGARSSRRRTSAARPTRRVDFSS